MSSETQNLTEVQVPARIANIAFRILVPGDWQTIPLPEEQPDFDKPDYFLPLHVCMAGYGVVVFSIAARPGFGDGTVQQWVQYIASQQGVQIEQLQRVTINGLVGIMANAVQQSDAGLMRMRTVFVEDGGRLINISTMAPAQIWPSVESQLDALRSSFKLNEPLGATAELGLSDAAT